MSGYTGLVDATIDFVTGTFDAQDVRLGAIGNRLPGLYAKGDFTVSQRGAGANASVDISSGRVFLEPGGPAAMQGMYLARTEATYNTSSDGGYSWTAADATNPRIDLLCVEAADVDEGGSFTGFKFRIVDGTPNAGATHQLETAYWPAVPNYCVPIAAIHVPANDNAINTASITNLNPVSGPGRAAYSYVATAETTTSATYTRLTTPDFVFLYVPHTTARVRMFGVNQSKIDVAAGTVKQAVFANGVQLVSAASQSTPVLEGSVTPLQTKYVRTHFPSNSYVSNSGTDTTDVTTGMAIGSPNGAEIYGMTAGWYLFDLRFQTSANVVTVRERRMWAEVIG